MAQHNWVEACEEPVILKLSDDLTNGSHIVSKQFLKIVSVFVRRGTSRLGVAKLAVLFSWPGHVRALVSV